MKKTKKNTDIKINALIVLCKLSDGSIRSINTDREVELKVIETIEKECNGITFSAKPILGVDIEIPA